MRGGCTAGALLLAVSLVSVSRAFKVEMASVLFRHGDRSPTHTYPKDRYQESHWPQGFGQLSTEGMRQEYFLGELLRKNYVETLKLIDRNYTRVQVYVRSTDYDRTLMSAQAMLSALFPPKEDQVFNSSLPWQPIPVHTVPQKNDTLLRAYSLCPEYGKLREEDTMTKTYIDIEKENEGFFKSLENETGYDVVNLSIIHSIRDVLYIEELNNLTLPDWVNDTLMDHLLNLTLYTGSLMFNSHKKNQLTAGNWVGKVVDDMVTKKNNPENGTRLYLYSAHDTTVATMMTALGVFNGELPPYVATFFIELLSDDNGDYWVVMYYRNETYGTDLWQLHVDSCRNTSICTLDEFIKFKTRLTLTDWEAACGISSRGSSSSSAPNTTVVALGVLLAMCAMVLLALIAGYTGAMCYRHRNRHVYSKIPNVQDST